MPGPNKPKVIDSFIRPMIEEFKCLERGVPGVYNAHNDSYFTLHGYLLTVTADMPARDELMGMAGFSSYQYCNYCDIRGVFKGHVYCPLTPPMDSTADEKAQAEFVEYPLRPLLRGSKRKRGVRNGDIHTRTHAEMKNYAGLADKLKRSRPKKESIHFMGMKRTSIFFELTSILFPWSFPLDSMHLFFLNVAKRLKTHWHGNYFKWETDATANAKNNRGRSTTTKDRYNIPNDVWKDIDADMAKLKYPTSFGDRIRGVFDFNKANEWKTWVKVGTNYPKGR